MAAPPLAPLLLLATLVAIPVATWAQTPPAQTPSQTAAPAAHNPPHHTPEHPAPEHPTPEHPVTSHRAEHHTTAHNAAERHAPAHPPVVQSHGRPARQKPAAVHAPVHPPVPAPTRAPVPAVPAPDASVAPDKGSVTGLPLPRFASLRSDDVNLRAGPGTRYPIDWVYKRRDLPVEIEREFDVWRLVSDQDGVRGWVNQATLMARRGFVVSGAERTIRNVANDQASPVARLQVGVIGRLRTCAAGSDWCEVQVGEYRGWIKRTEIWGVLPGEVVQP